MTKSKNKRQQQTPINGQPSKKQKSCATVTPPPEKEPAGPKTIQGVGLDTEDLELAIDTLTTLSSNPAVIKSKACKDLRTAVFGFRKACTTGFNASEDTNLTAKVSGALADGGYTEAKILLAEMRIRGQTPKLGALCRWVRDLDVVSGLAEQLGGQERSTKEAELLAVLDAILRLTGPTDYTMMPGPVPQPMFLGTEWNLRDGGTRQNVYDSVFDKSISALLPEGTRSQFRIIETTPGAARKPANYHPAILHASADDAVALEPGRTSITYHDHPVVPNLHLLKDVLSQDECVRIIAAAEMIGFTPDAPVRDEGDEVSILAHNFYWIVDNAFCSKLWGRVEPHVPKEVGGRKVRGLNRRFRVYRYVPGAEYRTHIDGAWPPSSIDPVTDKYIYDSSPPDGKQSSLFTFLIYLNDEFDAGETTFFLPSVKEGSLNAYQVKPVQGSVAMFPHGETEGSLLHEGTGVRKRDKPSAKYVIRTDVLYDVDPQ